jgi:Chaperone of endosialidase
VASGVGVIAGTTGQLGTVVSSARFKTAIKPMDKASEAILGLKPVTFRYKEELDPEKIPQFGLIAEEVEKVNPDLVVRDEEGKLMTVRYEAVNAMLLNEFLKEHRKVQELKEVAGTQAVAITQQQSTVSQLKATVAQQQKQIEVLTAGVQKVTARVEAANSVPRVVSDN